MGRRRQNKRQNPDFVDSEISLNNAGATSGSESEGSIVCTEGRAATCTNTEMPNSSVSTGCTTTDPNYTTVSVPSSHLDEEGHIQSNRQSFTSIPILPSTSSDMQDMHTYAGAGDDPNVQAKDEIAKLNITFKTFIEKVDKQHEVQSKALHECLTSVTNIVRENNTSMNECLVGTRNILKDTCTSIIKECMSGMTTLVKESNLQVLQ